MSLIRTVAAITMAASVAGVGAPALAQSHHGGGGGYAGHSGGGGGGYGGHSYGGRGGYGGGYGRYGGRGGDRYAYGAGGLIAGLALGSALSGGYYDRGYGGGAYYGDGYYGDGDYGRCVERRRVWDPYLGGYVVRRITYAC